MHDIDDVNIDRPVETRPARIRRRLFSPGRAVVFIVGFFVTLMGVVAIIQTGIDNDPAVPRIVIFSITQSAIVGMVEVVLGLVVMACALSEITRSTAQVVGLLAVAAGIFALASSAQLQRDGGFDSSTGWFFILWGALAVVGAVIPAVWEERREVDAYTDLG